MVSHFRANITNTRSLIRVGFGIGFFRDWDFYFENLENPRNPGDRDLKIPKKSRKKNSENPGDQDRDFKTSKKNPRKSRVQIPKFSRTGYFSDHEFKGFFQGSMSLD